MSRFPPLRKILFWAHLAAGIAAGSIILVMAATGVLLSFERQITEAADGYRVAAAGERLPLPELHRRLRESRPDSRPSGFLLGSSPTAPAVFQFGRERSLFVDPYTGAVLGEGAKGTRTFFRKVTELHRWLALSGGSRETGKSITSAAALVFLLILVSGLFLWIPRRWTRRGLRAVTTLQPKLRGRARDWNWHNTLGIWSAVPLLVTVGTGLVIAYPWANALLFKAVGEEAPQRHGPPKDLSGDSKGSPGPRRRSPSEGPLALPEGLENAIGLAVSACPAWQQLQFSFPPDQSQELTLYLTEGHGGRPDLRREITVDLTAGRITATKDFASQSKGRRLRSWVRWVHTGEAGGWIGQTISALASLGAVILIWTGFALSFRRFFGSRRRKPS